MAKNTAKQGLKPASSSSNFVAGWGFWLIAFAVLYGPAWYLGRESVFETERNSFVPWVIALTLAAVGAGLLSFAVNYVMGIRAESVRKQARQKKKKK